MPGRSPSLRSLIAAVFGSDPIDQVGAEYAGPESASQRLPSGWYTFEVLAIDGSGNTAFDVYTWFIDADGNDVGSDASALSPPSEDGRAPSGWYTFEVRAIDESGNTASNVYSWFLDGGHGTNGGTEAA